jgi:hypothetical protein
VLVSDIIRVVPVLVSGVTPSQGSGVGGPVVCNQQRMAATRKSTLEVCVHSHYHAFFDRTPKTADVNQTRWHTLSVRRGFRHQPTASLGRWWWQPAVPTGTCNQTGAGAEVGIGVCRNEGGGGGGQACQGRALAVTAAHHTHTYTHTHAHTPWRASDGTHAWQTNIGG